MNDKIRQHVAAYCASKGCQTSDNSIFGTIRNFDPIWEGERDSYRWWDELFVVVEINGMKIGFVDARTTGDDSPYDKGWEFDPSTICEVEERTETIIKTTYTPVKEAPNVG